MSYDKSNEYKGFIIRYKHAVYEICSLRDGVPTVVEDSDNIEGLQSGYFAYDFRNNKMFDSLEELHSAIDEDEADED